MLNILHINIGYPPAQRLGGPTRTVSNAATEQARRGNRVTVVCTNLHDKKSRIFPGTVHTRIQGVEVHYLRTSTIPLWPGTVGPFWAHGLPAFLRKELQTFDILHMHGVRDMMTLAAGLKAAKLGVPYVIQPHGEVPHLSEAFLKGMYDRLLTRRILRKLSAFVALSAREAQECREMAPDVPVEIVSNGIPVIDPSSMPAKGWLRARAGVPAGCPVILFLGRLNWIKGLDLLLEGFARMRHRSMLVFAGPDEGEQHRLTHLARSLGVEDRIVFVGAVSPEDVTRAYIDADVFAMTSRKELFPNTVMEACSIGLPIVMTDTCEITNLVIDRAAIVTPPDAGALAAAFDRVLGDSALRKALSEGGKNLAAREFSIAAAVDKLDALYCHAISRQKEAAATYKEAGPERGAA